MENICLARNQIIYDQILLKIGMEVSKLFR